MRDQFFVIEILLELVLNLQDTFLKLLEQLVKRGGSGLANDGALLKVYISPNQGTGTLGLNASLQCYSGYQNGVPRSYQRMLALEETPAEDPKHYAQGAVICSDTVFHL